MPLRLTPAVRAILLLCVGAFLIQNIADQFLGYNVLELFALVPVAFVVQHRVWQIFTYAFMHADVLHILLNMLMLVFTGAELEATWGSRRFVVYYLFCEVFAGLCYLLMQVFSSSGAGLATPMVGASGAIYGLLIAYGILFGERVMLFMMLFPMKAKHFIWILAGVEFFTAAFARKSGLSSIAHLGGMLGGILFLWFRARWSIYQREQKKRPMKPAKKKNSHLKLVVNKPKAFESDSDDRDGKGPKTWH
jgi:membrane associated rhomboid family serine protease